MFLNFSALTKSLLIPKVTSNPLLSTNSSTSFYGTWQRVSFRSPASNTFDEDHFFVDLVFYNRLLRCYVLVDLKLDKLTHQDLGQMQMYVNHFDRHVRTSSENPTIGILLCKRKKEALIQLTLPKNANIFASRYQLYFTLQGRPS